MLESVQILPLHCALAGARLVRPGLKICVQPQGGCVLLQGPQSTAFREAARAALDCDLPEQPNTVAHGASAQGMWLWPGAWLLACPEDEAQELCASLGAHLESFVHFVLDVSHQYTTLDIAGEGASGFLTRHCALERAALASGRCARTLICDVPILVSPTKEGFELRVERSLARFVWSWLEEQTR